MNIDIVKDDRFSYGTKVLRETVTDLRRQLSGAAKHHIPITEADNCIMRLYSEETRVFDVETPCGLLNKSDLKSPLYKSGMKSSSVASPTI